MSGWRAFVPVAALGLACVVLSACSSAASSRAVQSKAHVSTTRAPASTATASTTTTTTTTLPAPVALYRPLASPRPLRILVVGDSVARSFSVGLESWARETGKATVLDDARDWCSLGRFLPRNVFGPQNSSAGCDDWGTRWANDVATFDPDVVFVMFTIWEVVPRKLVGATDYERPGNPALDAWQLSEYQHAADVLSARGAPVVWFSIACEGPKPIQRGEPLWYVNRRTIPALARSRPLVRLIDIDGLLCNGAHMVTDFGGVANIRPDRAHYSPAGALAIAKWVMPIVLGETRAPPYAPN